MAFEIAPVAKAIAYDRARPVISAYDRLRAVPLPPGESSDRPFLDGARHIIAAFGP